MNALSGNAFHVPPMPLFFYKYVQDIIFINDYYKKVMNGFHNLLKGSFYFGEHFVK